MKDRKPTGHHQTNTPPIINPSPSKPNAGVPSSTMTPRPERQKPVTTEPKRENNPR